MGSGQSSASLLCGFRIIVVFALGLVFGLSLAFLGTGRITPLQALLFASIPSAILLAMLWLVHAGVRTPQRNSPGSSREEPGPSIGG